MDVAYKLMNKIDKMAAYLDRQDWGYEIVTNSYTDGDQKILVSGVQIEETNGRLYVVNGDSDDVYSAVEPRSIFKFMEKECS